MALNVLQAKSKVCHLLAGGHVKHLSPVKQKELQCYCVRKLNVLKKKSNQDQFEKPMIYHVKTNMAVYIGRKKCYSMNKIPQRKEEQRHLLPNQQKMP